LTWISFLRRYQIEYNITTDQSFRYLFIYLVIATIQWCVISLVALNMPFEFSKPVSPGLLAIRLICVILLHFQIECEVWQAVQLFKYMRKYPEEFVDRDNQSTKFPCGIISFFQLVTPLLTEAMNMMLILQTNSVIDAIQNYVALAIICQIDNIYLATLKSEGLKEVLQDKEKMPLMPEIPLTSIKRSKRSLTYKWIKKSLMSLYASYYYYISVGVLVVAYYFEKSSESP